MPSSRGDWNSSKFFEHALILASDVGFTLYTQALQEAHITELFTAGQAVSCMHFPARFVFSHFLPV